MDDLVRLLSESLAAFHVVVPNWGIAIVLLTTSIRVLLTPLQFFIQREQAKLAKLKPELDRLQLLYAKDLPRLMRERSEAMKKENARPGLSFVFTLVQLPIFFGIYQMISSSPALETSAFGWIPSLASADPLFVLPLVAALLMWWQTRLSAQPMPAPLRYAMPVVSFAFLATVPAAVALYSVTSSVVQVVSQRILEKVV